MVRMAYALLVVFALSASSAAFGSDGRANAWTTPHVLTISDGGSVNTLNPHLEQSAPVANMSELTGAWLVRWDERNQPYPELATVLPTRENGGVSADGLTITYHLRHGVKWSDGAPFTADDVVFSTNVVNDPANNEGGRWDMIAKVREPDKYTVVYQLKKPYSTSLETFFSSCCANPSILPKHILAKYRSINNVPYNALPVGIGPFKFVRWDRDKQVVMAANPLYWRGRPKLAQIIYKIIPNRDELLERLQTHQVDMWYQFSGAYLPRISALPEFTIFKQPSYAYNHFDFNVTHPVVADPVVRQALRYALNRQELVDKVGHGVGVVQDSATPVNAPYFVNVGTTPYDPAKANAMLDATGWVRGADGIRAKNGLKLVLNYALIAGQPDSAKQAELAAADWKQVGVSVNIQQYPAHLFFAQAQQGGVIYGDKWDVVTFAYAADPMGDYTGYLGCNQFPPVGGNDARWCNKRAQAAMDALFSHYDNAQRTADVKAVMEQLQADVPSIVSAIRIDMFAYNTDLKNYHPNDVTIFDNMMNVDI